jgi:hypothetical protein
VSHRNNDQPAVSPKQTLQYLSSHCDLQYSIMQNCLCSASATGIRGYWPAKVELVSRLEAEGNVGFEIFDKASRGAWCSVMLLLRTKGKSLAAVGAGLTLLLLATDTIFQQVLDFPERWIESTGASVATVIRYQPDLAVEF